jgi:hypothetical protein
MKKIKIIFFTALIVFASCNNSEEEISETLFTGSSFRASEFFSEVRRSAEIVRFEARLLASNSTNSRVSSVSSEFEDFESFEDRCLEAIGANGELRSNYHMISDLVHNDDLFSGDLSVIYNSTYDGSARIREWR